MKEKIISLYKSGISCKQIAKEVGSYPKAVSTVLKENNITIKKGPEYLRQNERDENYFHKIDTPDKAYFLGLLYADGNIYLKRNRVQITLWNEDVYILEKMANAIKYTGKMYIDRIKYTKLIIDSKIMVNDLINKGCIPNKSLILKFPTEEQVPAELQRHFIRGYFDGDGCISTSRKQLNKISVRRGAISYNKQHLSCNITSTKEFINSLSEILNNNYIYTGEFIKRYPKKELSAGTCYISRAADIEKFYKYIYEDCNDIYLLRKKDKFEEIIKL